MITIRRPPIIRKLKFLRLSWLPNVKKHNALIKQTINSTAKFRTNPSADLCESWQIRQILIVIRNSLNNCFSTSTGVCPSVIRPNVTGRCFSGIQQTRPSRQSSVDTDSHVPWRCCEVPAHVDLYTGSSHCRLCRRVNCCRPRTAVRRACSKQTTLSRRCSAVSWFQSFCTTAWGGRLVRTGENVARRSACVGDTNPEHSQQTTANSQNTTQHMLIYEASKILWLRF